jgi:hypothetical protein
METFLKRILRAIKLESQLYEEVEADQQALPQALGVVILSSLAMGIAAMAKGIEISFVSGALSALIGWFAWSYIVFFIGSKILPEPETVADYGQLLRTIGFASAPGLLAIIGIIPFLYGFAIVVSWVWMLVATVIAVRQAMDYQSTGRAILVSVIGWIIYAIIQAFFIAIVS